MKLDILMVGVGGQGTVLSSNIVCDVALANGYDVKKSEIHGMAQRGGSVVTHIRVGDEVFAPTIPDGSADIIVSFEKMEFLRYMDYYNENTILVLNTQVIAPPSVADGTADYPEAKIEETKTKFSKVYETDAISKAMEIGNPKVAGMIVLGILAKGVPFKKEAWEQAIKDRVPPKTTDLNLKAFDVGYNI
ncbi:Pyruvate/ketoisovalerate oxidoreductase [Denitrovibrio acetiphilus DSM 12809]|uniref:Pyruvate/ketoisovalerate oxidoreductase n=1 Tax=Denitrovibrio acetiphilus (strain DSM 12809 / NBRC 114555 / N2460) TaxID=522772 RepID=D4H7W4_DENA2|nr:indolepyruvate oxidoreductase subunit beta [Denitrovibrio acetiphilus]ADD68113.1 Pyruvate/ketoisovalerate oxidoreductase [Denitrovibrio acetiphilus DSM 12809]